MPFTKLLTKSLKYSRHGHMLQMDLLTLRLCIWYAQLHSYIQIDITLVFINVSIVLILHYAPLYSTYKAF